ncbi:MAG: hypothetical protein GY761_17645 [Hyphomicrobiales bacterium]|nr:hypothetical protein [Hyphomicrobiales bacterium]
MSSQRKLVNFSKRQLSNLILRYIMVDRVKTFSIICMLYLFHPACAETFTYKQILKDIDFVVKNLKIYHPNLYAHKKPREFKKIVDEVRKSIAPNEDYYSALPKFQRIMAAVCDEHTSIKLNNYKKLYDPNKPDTWRIGRLFADNLIATKNRIFMDNPAITFNRQTLLSINNHQSEEIRRFLENVSHADGCSNSGILYTRLGSLLDRILISQFLKIHKNTGLKVQSADDEAPRTYSQKALSLSDYGSPNKFPSAHEGSSRLLKNHGFSFNDANFVQSYKNKNLGIMVSSNTDKSTYYIYSYSFLGGKKQIKKTNKLMREMLNNKPTNVILDLTDNYGGQLHVASHLLSYFLEHSHRTASHVRMRNPNSRMPKQFVFASDKIRKSHIRKSKQFRRTKKRNGQYKLRLLKKSFGNPDYNGNLTILVSPRTHSAATVVASVLKRKRKAKLIGYVNAGSTRTSCFASPGYFELPNTKIAVLIPNTCFDRPKNTNQNGRTLKPDIEVDPLGGSSNYLNTRILEAALKEISAPKQNP